MTPQTTHSGLAVPRWFSAGAIALLSVLLGYTILGGFYVHTRSSQVLTALEHYRSLNQAAVADLEEKHPDLADIKRSGLSRFNAWNALWIDNLSRILANRLEAGSREIAADLPSGPAEPGDATSPDPNPSGDRAVAAVSMQRDAKAVQPGLGSKLLGPEQFVSYILAVYAGLIIAGEIREVSRQRSFISRLAQVFPEGIRIRPDSVGGLVARLRSGNDAASLVGELTYRALQRFERTKDVAASDAVVRADGDTAAGEFNSRLSMVRFVIWATPSIGFIGTVRGIGSALGNASDSAKLPEVVSYLGVAFDTTFVALLLSIALVLFSHELERRTDQLLEDVQGFCLGRVVRRFDPTSPAALGLGTTKE